MGTEIKFTDPDAFDAFIVREGFHEIRSVVLMEEFMFRAADRYHVLKAEIMADGEDDEISQLKIEALKFLSDQFTQSMSDLQMFFSETDDYYDQSQDERKRLNSIADLLVGSGRDAGRLKQAELLRSR